MGKIIFFLVIILSFQSWSKADDISDFQMEGISIGDSLLNFSTEKKIKSAKSNRQYPNDKFIIYEADKFLEINNYNFFAVTTKKNDKNYIITSMSGSIYFNKLEECYEIRNQIKRDIEKLINFDELEESKYKSQDGIADIDALQYFLKPYPSVEAIVLNCNQYTEGRFKNDLSVSVNPEDYAYFLINEAYK